MNAIRSRLSNFTADIPPTYWFLWLGILINRLGSFVIPFLTIYLTSQRGISVSQAALTVSLFGAGSFFSQVVGGELTDRLGRRPVMLLSLFIAPIAMIALGFAESLSMIAICTTILGFFTDLYRPALGAATADLVPPSARIRAFGYQNWAVNFGFSLAAILAGLLARYNYLYLFVGDALTTLLFGLIVYMRIPETRPAEASQNTEVPFRERARQIGREKLLLVFSGLALFVGIIYMQGYVTLPIAMQANGLSPTDYGFAISVNSILIVLTSIQVSHMAGKWHRFGVMSLAVLFLGAGFGLNAWAQTLSFYVFSVMVWTLGEIMAGAVAPAIIADLSPVELRGAFQGIFGAAWGLAAFVGPLAGGWVYEHWGGNTLWIGCFLIGSFLAMGYLLMSVPAKRQREQASAQSS